MVLAQAPKSTCSMALGGLGKPLEPKGQHSTVSMVMVATR